MDHPATITEGDVLICSWCRKPANLPPNGCIHSLGHYHPDSSAKAKNRGRPPSGITPKTSAQRQAKRSQYLKEMTGLAELIDRQAKRIAILERGIDEAIDTLTGLAEESGKGIMGAFSQPDFEPRESKLMRLSAKAQNILRWTRNIVPM